MEGESLVEAGDQKKAPRSFWGHLNQPVMVTVIGGLIVFLITSYIQNFYWRSQQKFLRLQQRTEVAEGVVEELAKKVGELRAASASLVGAHEQRYERKQLNEVIDRYDTAQKDWDESEGVLNLRIEIYFAEDSRTNDASARLSKSLDALDDDVSELLRYTTADPGDAHKQSIKKCRDAIDDVDGALGSLQSQMIKEVRASRVNK